MKQKQIGKKFLLGLFLIGITIALSGCTESDTATTQTKDDADNFKQVRECTVYNTRSDRPLFHIIANFSLTMDEADSQLELICKTKDRKGKTVYKRHLIRCNVDTIYMVNDVSDQDYSLDHYEYEDYRTLKGPERPDGQDDD